MSARRTVFVCDAGGRRGIGHVMRCLGLAEEVTARGGEAVFVADVESVPWAAEQVRSRGFTLISRPEERPDLVADVLALHPDMVVLDSYVTPAEVGTVLRSAGVPVLAIIDGPERTQVADLYVNQNIGTETDPWTGADRLAGLRYALLRDEVRHARPDRPRIDVPVAVPEVLTYFGGTDPAGAAPVCLRALAATEHPFHASVVTASPQLADAAAAVPLHAGQRITVTGLVTGLPAAAAAADLVLSASGTSVLELMCVGAAAALIWVADNQAIGYARAVGGGGAVGLGHIDDVRDQPADATEVLGLLLRSPGMRAGLRSTAWSLVDGDGRGRVVDALEALLPA
jgi:spore coat polysaccharide biosynthesis predicted glycosyltransferase SpsG